MKTGLSIIILAITAFATNGQPNRQEKITYEDNSTVRNIRFEVPVDTKTLSYQLNGFLLKGELTVEILDPEGRKSGGFGLGASLEKGIQKTANGHMSRDVSSPLPGIWILHIKTEHATGNLSYKLDYQ